VIKLLLIDKVLLDKNMNGENDRHNLLTFGCVADYGYKPLELCSIKIVDDDDCLKCWCRDA